MKNSYSHIRDFIMHLWRRQASGEQLLEKEEELIRKLEADAMQHYSEDHMKASRERIHNTVRNSRSSRTMPLARQAVLIPAAILVLFISIFGLYQSFVKPEVFVAEGSFRSVKLKDGSAVKLFPGAELTVERSFPQATRLVTLKGDAIFSVAKDRRHPFVVQAQNFSTKVLGTVFKITQTGNRKSVDLYEGRVAVSYAGVPDTYLKPNQVWANFGAPRTAVVFTKAAPGKKMPATAMQSLSFNEVAFAEIIRVLQEHYGISISYPAALAGKKLSAELEGTMEENIEMVAFAAHLEVETQGGKAYILK